MRSKIIIPDIIENFISSIDWDGNNLEKPFFFHGTPMQTNSHISKIRDSDLKYPMIYLYERLPFSTFYRNSPILLEANPILFFLVDSDWKNLTVDEIYSSSVDLMYSYMLLFQNSLNSAISIFDRKNSKDEIELFTTFGVFTDKKGYTKRIFNDNTSGCSLKFSLKLKTCSI